MTPPLPSSSPQPAIRDYTDRCPYLCLQPPRSEPTRLGRVNQPLTRDVSLREVETRQRRADQSLASDKSVVAVLVHHRRGMTPPFPPPTHPVVINRRCFCLRNVSADKKVIFSLKFFPPLSGDIGRNKSHQASAEAAGLLRLTADN